MEVNSPQPIAILGAGSWGTALGLYLSRRAQVVKIWSIETAEITSMLSEKANNRYLPGISLPDCLEPTIDLADTVRNIKDILIVVPSVGFRKTLEMVKPLLSEGARIICATKGLDAESGKLLNEVSNEVLGSSHPFAVLSGPSFAREVAQGLPVAVVIASKHSSLVDELADRFDSDIFRISKSTDVKGVEIGSVVKNVLAIATGISDGMNLGASARSALLTYGLAEMTRLGMALGAEKETFVGLSGIGDLILTATDDLSRNRRYGLAIGKGGNVAEAEKQIGQVVEGKRNAELVVMLAKKHQLSLPICETIWAILQKEISVAEGVKKFLRG